MPKQWRFQPHDQALVRQVCRDLNVSALTAQILVARGVRSGAEAARFLEAKLTDLHEPELLPGITEAADRVVSAVKAGRKITIYGDYDVDGVTATSLLWHCLKLAGAEVAYYIPCRMEEGYGLNREAIRTLAEADPNQLVVTVDCGICSVAEAALAKELGLELVITDHHHFDAELPAADCLVHPRLPGSAYPFGDLCGVGVAVKLAWAVCNRLGDGQKASPRMREFLMSAVGLAAIGTIADVVPLLGENRLLVRYGLGSLARRSSVGLQSLMTLAGIDTDRVLDAEDVSFGIAPRINAAGRLGQARLSVELLTTASRDRALQLAQYHEELNKNRKTVERRIFKEAREMVEAHPEWAEHKVLVLADAGWHPGVVGIVASRIVERFEKPAILLTIDRNENLAKGSGRTFAGFNLHAGLTACADALVGFGGHPAAVGVRVAADRIDEFRALLVAHVHENYEADPQDFEMRVDAEVRLADVSYRAVKELERIGPFGQGNPKPVFAASGVELAGPPRTMGEGDRHLDLRLRQHGTTMRAIAFGRGEWAAEIAAAVNGSNKALAVAFTAGINRFRGQERVELKLEDWQAEEK
jgi:single-stranded-DNA-specific exonuclease